METRQNARDIILGVFKKSQMDLSAPEICEKTGLHKNTVWTWLKVLKAEKKIEVTRKVGKTEFYKAR